MLLGINPLLVVSSPNTWGAISLAGVLALDFRGRELRPGWQMPLSRLQAATMGTGLCCSLAVGCTHLCPQATRAKPTPLRQTTATQQLAAQCGTTVLT